MTVRQLRVTQDVDEEHDMVVSASQDLVGLGSTLTRMGLCERDHSLSNPSFFHAAMVREPMEIFGCSCSLKCSKFPTIKLGLFFVGLFDAPHMEQAYHNIKLSECCMASDMVSHFAFVVPVIKGKIQRGFCEIQNIIFKGTLIL